MRAFALGCALLVLAACAKPDTKVATDTTTAAAPMGAGATPAPISLADVAGKWSMETMNMTSDSVLVRSELNIASDGSGATLTFANRPPIPGRVTASGDSLISEFGPYESALRKGVQVRTSFVVRRDGAGLAGKGAARYNVNGPDSLLQLRLRGTKLP